MKQLFDAEKFVEDKKPVDEATISSAMACNADLLGFYGYQEALWGNHAALLKVAVEAKIAQKSISYKEEADSDKRKTTDAIIKSMVEADSEVLKLKHALEVAKGEQRLYSIAVSTIEHKGKMLISYGAHMRSEMDNLGMHTSNSPIQRRTPPEGKQAILDKIYGNTGENIV